MSPHIGTTDPGRPGGALVTGAARGLGREVASRLAGRGYAVHLTDVDGALAETAAEEIAASTGGCVFASQLDVRDQSAVREAARRTVAAAGSLTLWVNNAGVLLTGPAWAQTDETRRLMFEVNALGTMHGTVAALEVMRPARHGHIVNVVSLAGLVSVPGEAVYAATKHAAMGLSLSTLADLRVAGERDIHISCICPDGMWTPMLFDKLDDAHASMSFSGKLLRPEQVADLVERVVDRPRPVLTAPRWRGLQVRLFDLAPGLAMRFAPTVVRLSRAQQRATSRKLSAQGETRPPEARR